MLEKIPGCSILMDWDGAEGVLGLKTEVLDLEAETEEARGIL
jgi:hypothetical protein